MPSLAPVAGTMATAEFVVHNGSSQEITLSNAILIVKDGPAGAAAPDPREFYMVPRTGPPGAGLGTITTGNPSFGGRKALEVDVPLRLSPASPADELRLDLVADNQQWCLRATDSQGRPATGPFEVALAVAGSGTTSMVGELPITNMQNTWAMRWSSYGNPSHAAAAPITLTVWVGGSHYVTARAEARIAQ
jgi:hypothetical protein